MAGQTLVVLAAPCHRRSDLGRAHLSRHLGARLRESQTLGDPRLSRAGTSRDAASLARRISNPLHRHQKNQRQSTGAVFLGATNRLFRTMARPDFRTCAGGKYRDSSRENEFRERPHRVHPPDGSGRSVGTKDQTALPAQDQPICCAQRRIALSRFQSEAKS